MRHLLLILILSYTAHALSLPEKFTADFTQQITNPKKKVITYQGKVYFSNKTFFKWDYTSPTKKQVCSNGRELTVVDHDLEQVSQYDIDKGFNFSKVLKNAKLHKKNIYVAKYENKSYTIQVDAQQRLQSIAYFDDLDNKVQIIFKKVKYAKGNLSKKIMTCKIPKAYDIIRG
ncbi:MAG: LolA-like outer membrane lipoprotein chaperone [Sulfurovum sp.]|nr:LolA-like outer membrane lipoprotein chaperone [Sulfurovum sp.]